VTPPAGAQLCSNVYQVSVLTSAGPAKVGPMHGAVAMMLRSAPAVCTSPTLERHSAGGWTPLATDQTGQDIWGALLTQFGDYALIAPATGTSAASPGSPSPTAPRFWSGGPQLLLIGAGVIVICLAVSILAVRRSRTSPRP
jgi:hypothetical protein